MIDEYHPIQRKILTDLLFGNKLKYSELKPFEMEGSQFTFHLNKLIDLSLISKDGLLYFLTPHGKNVANTFDTDSVNPRKQAKQSVVFCAFRTFNNQQQTLVYTRKKNPFFNHQGYPTGKVMYGESVLQTAERELYEETGLRGEAYIVSIRHFRVYFPTEKDLVEDKTMYICRIDEPSGELRSNEEGEFVWADLADISHIIHKPLPEFQETFDLVTDFTGEISFAERNHYPSEF